MFFEVAVSCFYGIIFIMAVVLLSPLLVDVFLYNSVDVAALKFCKNGLIK